MARHSLLEYFQPDSRPSAEVAVVWRRGYRITRWTYGDLFQASAGFCGKLRSIGVRKGDRVILWGENSGEWVAAFLGCMFCGAICVPLDAIGDKEFALRVAKQSGVSGAIIGRGFPPLDVGKPIIILEELCPRAAGADPDSSPFETATCDDPAEIVFTSGTTAEPRGVVLTHGNILANLEPLEKEIEKYRRYERLFHPLRFLDLLPLSHVFGQLLGIFLPQIVGATSVFTDSLNPSGITRTIHDERVSVLITVPRLIDSLKDSIERDLETRGELAVFQRKFLKAERAHFVKRWWLFRGVHRTFGWRFWAIISGGSALSSETEKFWGRLGYALIQGYGLTETTSLVSVNHPFRLGRGSIGKSLPGREVKLADDGEILVRGESVAQDYLQGADVTAVQGKDGWFHTGDIGELDAAGNLYFKGRSKNVIVTPEGLNVYPQDLEAELRKEPNVRDCVVLGLQREGNAEPCAVLLLRNPSDQGNAAGIVDRSNSRLAPFQQMRYWMVWEDSDFPRTPTQKPVLAKIRRAVENHFAGTSVGGTNSTHAGSLHDLLTRVTGGVAAGDAGARLQLSSIERVELLSALEDRYQLDLSEAEFSNVGTVDDIQRLLRQRPSSATAYHYPRWAQRWPFRFFRAVVFNVLARPAMLLLGWPGIRGREHLADTNAPALVIANHIAFFDPAYIMEALPERFRRKLAVAMDGELLESMRNPPRGRGLFVGIADRVAYWLIVSIYNVFPLPLHAGFRKSFAFVGDLIDRGWNVLIFPEGTRSRDGRMSPFRAGIGLLATQLAVPVIPVRMDGIAELRATGKHWARPGQIKLSIGAPVRFEPGASPEHVAHDLEKRVASLQAFGSL